MADPERYIQSFDFSAFQETFPSTPLPGQQVDIQLADIATSTNSLRNAIMDVRRSDGKLKNGIVTPDSLSASLSLGFTLRGNWADATAYAAGDGVVYDETFYKALVAHTSSPGSRPDLDATRWDFLFTMSAIAVTDGSITPAKLENSQGEAFHAKIETATYMGPIIDGLTSKASPVSADSIAISDSAATAASKKLTLTNLASWLFSGLGALIAAATAKATPVDADMLLIADSLDSNASKKTTVAALKTGMGLGTSGSPQFSSVEVGHATDTTLERAAAGFISVEGKRVPSPASQASGDLLYRGSTEWERLAKGTALQALRMNSGATAPEWAAPAGMLLLTSGTVSAAATLDIVLTSYTGYKGLAVQLFNFLPATNNVILYLRTSTNGGVSYDAGASDYRYMSYDQNDSGALNSNQSAGAAQIAVCSELSNSSTLGGINVGVCIWGQTAAAWGKFTWNGTFGQQAGRIGANWGGGARATGADVDAVRFLMSTGNITSGGYAVYGYV